MVPTPLHRAGAVPWEFHQPTFGSDYGSSAGRFLKRQLVHVPVSVTRLVNLFGVSGLGFRVQGLGFRFRFRFRV